jgi:DNA primase catalytic core
MARIPAADLERLKEEVSVQRLVAGAGIELKRAGKDWLGHCPFHDDREASLVVTPSKNLWHCFGCQIGGGPIDWVMKQKGVSFRHAVELLREGLPSLAASAADGSPTAPLKRTSVRALAAPVSLDADDQRVLDETIEYYHQRLQDVPEARAYLAARGLDHPQVIEHFKLGVADRSLGLRLPEKNRAAGAAIRTQLQRIGLLRQSGHEHFNGSLVIPVFNEAGQVVEVYGRKLRDDLRPGTPKHLYLPGPHAGVFNLGGVVEAGQREPGQREVILCEALIDALTFWVHEFTNVTSAFGIEGFTDDILQALKASGIERVLIAYDRDEPGERAAEKLAPRLIAEGLEVLRVQFPQGHDANEFARLQPNPKQALGLVLRQALWLGRAPQPPAVPLPLVAPAPATINTAAAQPEALPPLAADPVPAAQATSGPLVAGPDVRNVPNVEAVPDELHIEQGGCQWRVRGWRKNLSPEQMRVNVQVRRVSLDGSPAGYHMDTLDLYSAKARASFIRQAAIELGLSDESVKRDLGHVLLRLETLQDDAIRVTKAPKQTAVVLGAQDEADALALLRDPDLCERIAADLQACGVVGERTNLLAGYLAAVSRKLDTPLAVLIQSSSAAGKSSLMEAVLNLVPPEERIQYSAMTGQSLFYLGETDLKHKILAIAEEEGVRQAAYALKLLQSEGQLTMASTGKDEATGNLVTKQYRVEGPVMLMLTTTAIDVDEELMNRCLVLTVNESREQTRAIHERQRQRQTLDGLLADSHKAAVTALHRNAQRLLRPIHVVNPYADQLTFVDHQTRTRRDHTKYLSLIRAIALLHQHQREIKTVEHRGQTLAYIEVTKADIAQANEIAHEVLGRTLDELPPQTRTLLMLVRDWVQGQCIEHGITQADWRFTRKQVRAATHWGDTQLKVHLARLVELEHLTLHRKGLSHEYELVYDAKAGADRPHLNGLLNADDLGNAESHAYDRDRSGLGGDRSASGRALVGGVSAIGRDAIECERTQQPCGLQADEAGINGHDAANALFRQDGKSPVVAVAARA